jgi:plasmid stability protein
LEADLLSSLDSVPEACHYRSMANLQIKNFPDALHRRLRRYAQKHHRTIDDVVLEALERGMARYEWHEKLSRRAATDLGDSAASLLEQERQHKTVLEHSK